MRVDVATQQRAVGAGQQAGVDDATQQRAVGGWTAERRTAEGSWCVTTDRGSQHWTPETVGDKIGSSEEDQLKMSAFEVLVEFSLVTHASDSLHMHVVLHNSFCSLLTPSVLFVFVRLFHFSPIPPIVFLCSGKEMCITPSATSRSPAG